MGGSTKSNFAVMLCGSRKHLFVIIASLLLVIYVTMIWSYNSNLRTPSEKTSIIDNWGDTPPVPNIVHFVKLGSASFSFTNMLAFRAAWIAQRPRRILIHCDKCEEIQVGRYWDFIQLIPGIELVNYKPRESIFGIKFGQLYDASDIARIVVLLKYGGIYFDGDAILINSLDKYRNFECSIGIAPGQSLGNQVIVAKPGALFLKYWFLSYVYYNPKLWYYNAGRLPTSMVLRRYPHLVHVVPFNFGIHYLVNQLYKHCSPDWRTMDAIHLLRRHIPKGFNLPELNETTVKGMNNSFAEISRYLLYGDTQHINDKLAPMAPVEVVAGIGLKAMPEVCRDRSIVWKEARYGDAEFIKEFYPNVTFKYDKWRNAYSEQ